MGGRRDSTSSPSSSSSSSSRRRRTSEGEAAPTDASSSEKRANKEKHQKKKKAKKEKHHSSSSGSNSSKMKKDKKRKAPGAQQQPQQQRPSSAHAQEPALKRRRSSSSGGKGQAGGDRDDDDVAMAPAPSLSSSSSSSSSSSAPSAVAQPSVEKTVTVTISAKPLQAGVCPPMVGVFEQNPPTELLRTRQGSADGGERGFALDFRAFVHADDAELNAATSNEQEKGGSSSTGKKSPKKRVTFQSTSDDGDGKSVVPRVLLMCDRPETVYAGFNAAAAAVPRGDGAAGPLPAASAGSAFVSGRSRRRADPADAGSRVAVGLFDPDTRRLTLVETPGLFSFETHVKGVQIESLEGALDSLTATEKRAATIEDFGSQKAKTASRTYEANKLSLESTPLVAGGTGTGADSGAGPDMAMLGNELSEMQREQLAVAEGRGAEPEVQRQQDDLPRFDAEATSAHRCYPLELIISEEDVELYEQMGDTVDDLWSSAEAGAAPLREFAEARFNSDATTTAIFVQWCGRVMERTTVDPNEPCTGRAGLITVLLACQLLHMFVTAQRKRTRDGDKRELELDERKFAADTSMPLRVLQTILRRTCSTMREVRKPPPVDAAADDATTAADGAASALDKLTESKITRASWLGVKLLLLEHFIFVLGLHATGQSLPLDTRFLQAMRWSADEARQHAVRLGCRVRVHKVKGSQATTKVAVLTAPLKFPSVARRSKSRG